MAKISKSVRVDEELNNLINDYITFLKRNMEIDLNFSEIVSEAVEMYLSKMITGYNKWMNCGNIVMPTITGRLQKIDFTKEQIQEIEVLSKRVEGLEDAIHSK